MPGRCSQASLVIAPSHAGRGRLAREWGPVHAPGPYARHQRSGRDPLDWGTMCAESPATPRPLRTVVLTMECPAAAFLVPRLLANPDDDVRGIV